MMRNTVFYLKTCDTNRKIIKDLGLNRNFNLREIKSKQITMDEIIEMKKLAGSFESLFNRRSKQYNMLGLKSRILTEDDYRDLILEHYTFLKRPVTIFNHAIYIGNSDTEVQKLRAKINLV